MQNFAVQNFSPRKCRAQERGKRNDRRRAGSEMESIKLTEGMAERCVTVLRVIVTGMNAWRRTRGSGGGRPPLQRAEGAHENYDRCPEIKGLPTERNKVSQSHWRPACSNVIGCGSAGVRYSSHTDPMPDFFHAPSSSPPSPPLGFSRESFWVPAIGERE